MPGIPQVSIPLGDVSSKLEEINFRDTFQSVHQDERLNYDLLHYLKDCDSSLKDLGLFMKRRAACADEYSKLLAKLSRLDLSTHVCEKASVNSWTDQLSNLNNTSSENQKAFAETLSNWSAEVSEEVKSLEKRRKLEKDDIQNREKTLQALKNDAERSISRYETLKEEHEKLLSISTGDQSRKGFAIRHRSEVHLARSLESSSRKLESTRIDSETKSTNFKQSELEARQDKRPSSAARIMKYCIQSQIILRYFLSRLGLFFCDSILHDAIHIQDFQDLMNKHTIEEELLKVTSQLEMIFSKRVNVEHSVKCNFLENNDTIPNSILRKEFETIFEVSDHEIPAALLTSLRILEQSEDTGRIYRENTTEEASRILSHGRRAEKIEALLKAHSESIPVKDIIMFVFYFFQQLPSPLIPKYSHQSFLDGVKLSDNTAARNSVHKTVNYLPDAAYAFLRRIVFHIKRVQESGDQNAINMTSLCQTWSSLLFGLDVKPSDYGYYSQTLEILVKNCFIVFDEVN